eukprot:gene14329-20317_t
MSHLLYPSRLMNMRSLLKLLASLCGLHSSGILLIDFSSQQHEAAGKSLVIALIRMLLDPLVACHLLPDTSHALQALIDAWGSDPQTTDIATGDITPLARSASQNLSWARASADLAEQLAGFGRNHRASLAAISALPAAASCAARALQQAAALQLVKKHLKAGDSSINKQQQGRGTDADPKDLRRLLLGGGSKPRTPEALIKMFASNRRSTLKAHRQQHLHIQAHRQQHLHMQGHRQQHLHIQAHRQQHLHMQAHRQQHLHIQAHRQQHLHIQAHRQQHLHIQAHRQQHLHIQAHHYNQ